MGKDARGEEGKRATRRIERVRNGEGINSTSQR